MEGIDKEKEGTLKVIPKNKKRRVEKFDKKTVENDFENFCYDWHIDDDVETMDDEDRDGFNNLKRLLTRAMSFGELIYNANETFSYFCVKSGDEIFVSRPDGRNYLIMDKYKTKESAHKQNALLAEMINKEPKFVSKLDGIDINILKGILSIFLSS